MHYSQGPERQKVRMRKAYPPALNNDKGLMEEYSQIERLAVRAGRQQEDELLHDLLAARIVLRYTSS